MNIEQQEYIKFWANIKEKCDEILDDYNKLSEENKTRVDSVKDSILKATSLIDIINILNSQIER